MTLRILPEEEEYSSAVLCSDVLERWDLVLVLESDRFQSLCIVRSIACVHRRKTCQPSQYVDLGMSALHRAVLAGCQGGGMWMELLFDMTALLWESCRGDGEWPPWFLAVCSDQACHETFVVCLWSFQIVCFRSDFVFLRFWKDTKIF